MYKCLALALLALAMSAPARADVVPLKGALLIVDDADIAVAAPGRPTMQSLHDDIEACRTDGCPDMASDEIDRLAAWVARGNRLAIRLSFAAAARLDGGAARALAQSYGGLIKSDPRAFLRLARDEGAPARIVTMDAVATADDMAGSAVKRELEARRVALLGVTDPALDGLRDACVSGITAEMDAIAASVPETTL